MNEQAIFLAAAEILDPVKRAEYLAQACLGDAALRRQVETLLAAHERPGPFLDVPALKQIADGAAGECLAITSADAGEKRSDRKDDLDLSFLLPSTQPGSLGRLGHYEVREVIGRGGGGIVLKAFDEHLERIVAVKVMASEIAGTSPARKRFLREARAAAAIRHDNVVNIYAVEDQPLPYLVMEYIDGQTLQQRLDEHGPLDVREVLQIGQQIAAGLEAAHAIGLIHRDIKPGNVLLEKGKDRVKITDFGLARAADDASLTQSGAITGTPLYMSPEQAKGDSIDQRSDLFSLGSVLYVMCSGRPPFRAATSMAVLMRVVQDAPRSIREIIPEVPLWLAAIIDKLHAKAPNERYGSAHEVADLLARCLIEFDRHGPVESLVGMPPLAPEAAIATTDKTTPPHAIVGKRRSGRKRAWIAAAAAVALFVCGLSVTEATGVTDVRSTIIRLFSPDGTLVVEVDDPGVSVTIDGEEMVITGTGAKEIRLKPGQYKLLASKHGKPIRQELVTVTRNGRQVVRVSKEGNPVEVDSDPDRRAAEYVLSIGGSIDVEESGKQRKLKPGNELPREPFTLAAVLLRENKKVTDAELACLKDCKHLTGLDLTGTNVTDAGLAHFKDHTKLVRLDLHFTRVTDNGVANFKNCKNLIWLGLGWTHVTDAGFRLFKDFTKLGNVGLGGLDLKDESLAVFEHCPDLWAIDLERTKISDAGLAHLQNCKQLWSLVLRECPNVTDGGLAHFNDRDFEILRLDGTKVSDAGLLHLKNCKKLFRLHLANANVSDAGLMHFKDCKELKELYLNGSQVSDAALTLFAACPNLILVEARKTKVTEAGVKKLADALPGCKIEWDGGVIEPQAPNRRAAEWSLSIGGSITIREQGQDRRVTAASDLPAGAFSLTGLHFSGNKKVNDEELTCFKDCENLLYVDFDATEVSDAGMSSLRNCRRLRVLNLNNTKVTDTGLSYFKDCGDLEGLCLFGTAVTDAGLANFNFKGRTKLRYLALLGTQVGDAGLAWLDGCASLEILNLQNTAVTNAGMVHLKHWPNLKELQLNNAVIDDEGVAHLKDCQQLTWLGLGNLRKPITDVGLRHLGECGNLTHLDVYSNQITDSGLVHLKHCKKLEHLSLLGTQLTDVGLEKIEALKNLRNLSLHATGNEYLDGKFTAEGVKKLAAALPECKIVWSGGTIEPSAASKAPHAPSGDTR